MWRRSTNCRVFGRIALVSVLTLLSLLSGCKKHESNEIVIGVILPLTGDGASYGQKEKEGIELAVSETGSHFDLRIQTRYEDSQGQPGPAVVAAQKLISQDKARVIIGDAFSSPTLAIVPIAEKNHVIVMSPSASSPKLSGLSQYFFRVWPSDVSEASTMAEIAVHRMGLSTFVTLCGNNEYGIGLRDVFTRKAQELGKQVIASEAYNEGDSDFRSQLTKIKQLAPDAVYLGGYYKEFAKILVQAREMGLKCQFLSCGTFHEPEVIALAGQAAEGVVFVQPFFNRESSDSLTQAFVRSYESRFQTEAGVYAAHAYDAAKVIVSQFLSGAVSPTDLQSGLLSLKSYRGVTGEMTFLAGGDVLKSARVMTVRNGKFLDWSAEDTGRQ